MLIIPTKFPKSEIRAGGSGIFDIGRNFFRKLTQAGIKNLQTVANSSAGKQVQNHLKKELESAAKKGTEQLIRKVKDTVLEFTFGLTADNMWENLKKTKNMAMGN